MSVTLEDLRAMPEGTTMAVRDRHWTRTTTGFRSDEFTVPVESFTVEVNAGSVDLAPAPAQGQVRAIGGMIVLLVEATDDNQWVGASFYGPDSFGYYARWVVDAEANRLLPRPEWMTPTLVSVATEGARAYLASLAENTTAGRDLARFKEGITTSLHNALNSTADEAAILTVLDEHGLGRPYEMVTVTVRITGFTEYDTAPEQTWAFAAVTFEIDDVTIGECGCGQVDREMVRAWLNDNDVTYSGFDFNATGCTHAANCANLQQPF